MLGWQVRTSVGRPLHVPGLGWPVPLLTSGRLIRPWKGQASQARTTLSPHIWKPIPVRIFYTLVIYQGYDMDILSEKRYDVIYHRYVMDIPNANDLEWHILVIYFLTFRQIF